MIRTDGKNLVVRHWRGLIEVFLQRDDNEDEEDYDRGDEDERVSPANSLRGAGISLFDPSPLILRQLKSCRILNRFL
jgi:hypothetical protein